MTDREKLIELLEDTLHEWECDVSTETTTQIAEHLLENGVIVPPCPIGTKIYMLVTNTFVKDSKLTFYNLERVIEKFGKTVFLTKEEAEQALKEMVGDKK